MKAYVNNEKPCSKTRTVRIAQILLDAATEQLRHLRLTASYQRWPHFVASAIGWTILNRHTNDPRRLMT